MGRCAGTWAREALLAARCVATDGRKHLLHPTVSNKESEAAWTELFRHPLVRNMRPSTTVTSDGALGVAKAITTCFPTSVRVRCWFHQLAKIRAKLPHETAGEVLTHVFAVRDAPTRDASRAAADRVVNTYGREYPSAVACFTKDLEALPAIHRVPVRRRIRVRTTNLTERCFVGERRRTKGAGRRPDEKAVMKLVFATMIRAVNRWCRVSIGDLERHQLPLLRAELGLDPPPATDSNETQTPHDPA